MATIEPTTLQEAVRKLALARSAEAAAKTALQVKQDAFAAENAALIATAKEAKTAVTQAEADVKALALAAYTADKSNRKPAPGVEIKLYKTISYAADKALEWAKAAKQCLVPEQLDVAKFEKVAGVLDLDFVTIGEEPKPTIATDLEKALAVAEVSAPAAPAVPVPPPAAAPEQAPRAPRGRGKKAVAAAAPLDEDPFA